MLGLRAMEEQVLNDKRLCACGCKQQVVSRDPSNRRMKVRFCFGHKTPEPNRWLKIPCGCGCGILIFSRDKANRIRKFASGHSQRIKNSMWRGGRWKHWQGYVYVYQLNHPYAKNGYVYEHRLVIEKDIGRYLLLTEHVHHINGIRDDNRIENLQLMTRSEHMSYEMTKKWRTGKMIRRFKNLR